MNFNSFLKAGLKTDKITHHGYHRIYPWFLEHYKSKGDLKMLEIGADEMGSVFLWLDYFPGIKLTIADIEKKEFPGIECIQLDQSNQVDLFNYAKDKKGYFDIIVDDGSHVPEHQKLTIENLWQTLKPGGIYIIEDIETSYWGKSEIYGYNFNATKSNIISTFISKLNILNKEFLNSKAFKLDSCDKILNETEIISFAYNCIILIKKNVLFHEFYDRKYRYAEAINSKRRKSIFLKLSQFFKIT